MKTNQVIETFDEEIAKLRARHDGLDETDPQKPLAAEWLGTAEQFRAKYIQTEAIRDNCVTIDEVVDAFAASLTAEGINVLD